MEVLIVEKRIIRAAGIQSIVFLILCMLSAIIVKNGLYSSVQADESEITQQEDVQEIPNYVYVIDAGHGGIDSGTLAIDPAYEEKDMNLAISKLVKEMLESDKRTKVYMTRETDKFLSPEDRIEYMNKLNPDRIISIHCNSAENNDAAGVEILYNEDDKESKELAKNCLSQIINSTNQVNRGLLEGNHIYIVRKAKAPIALVEVGFLSNKKELKFLSSSSNLKKIAEGIVSGIRDTERKTKE